MTNFERSLIAFQTLIGVRFRDPAWLTIALTHRSFVNEVHAVWQDNERLEFLGDAIIDFVAGDMVYRMYPRQTEGDLTQLRAALVRAESLAKLAEECQLGQFLRVGKGEEMTGGRTRINNLSSGFEALIGAVYMDSGLERVKLFALPRLSVLLQYVLAHNLHLDARSMLQERSQAEVRVTPRYRLVSSRGLEHEKLFMIEVVVGKAVIGMGEGVNKRRASQEAARNALQRLETEGWHPDAYWQEEPLITESELILDVKALDEEDHELESPLLTASPLETPSREDAKPAKRRKRRPRHRKNAKQ